MEAVKHSRGVAKLVDLIMNRFDLTQNKAFAVLVQVKRLNGGVLRGLKITQFIKMAKDIVTKTCSDQTKANKKQKKSKVKVSKTCPICYTMFHDNWNRDRHMEQKHRMEKIEWEISLDESSELESLKEAKKVDEYIINDILVDVSKRIMNQEKLICSYCSKVFSYKQSLKRHMNEHKEEVQTFNCNECDFKTNRLDSLSRHKQKKHRIYKLNFDVMRKDGRENNFECQLCKRVFGDSQAYETHFVTKACQGTNEDDAINDEGRHECSMCDKTYVNKSDLTKHYNWKHKAGNIFKCNMCGKNFCNQYTLSRHVRMKHNERK